MAGVERQVRHRGERVGDEDLLGQPEREQSQPRGDLAPRVCAGGKRRGDRAEPQDRARDQLREESQVAGVVSQAFHRLGDPPVDVHQRADRMEREEGDAQREGPARRWRRIPAEARGQPVVVLAGEAEILSEKQRDQSAADAEDEEGLAATCREIGPTQQPCETETPERQPKQERQQHRIPPAVEDIACDEQPTVPPTTRCRQQIIKPQHHRQEVAQKKRRGEDHGYSTSVRRAQ